MTVYKFEWIIRSCVDPDGLDSTTCNYQGKMVHYNDEQNIYTHNDRCDFLHIEVLKLDSSIIANHKNSSMVIIKLYKRMWFNLAPPFGNVTTPMIQLDKQMRELRVIFDNHGGSFLSNHNRGSHRIPRCNFWHSEMKVKVIRNYFWIKMVEALDLTCSHQWPGVRQCHELWADRQRLRQNRRLDPFCTYQPDDILFVTNVKCNIPNTRLYQIRCPHIRWS